VPSLSDFRSDSPLVLMFGLWLSLSCCWASGLVYSLDSGAAPLAVRCSNCGGLRGPTCVRTRTHWQSNGRCVSSRHALYPIRYCRSRIKFVEPSAGTTSRLRSIINDTGLTGDSTRWQFQCIRQEPAVTTTGAVRCDPARYVLVSALTSNQQSTGCQPPQQTASHRATAASRLATSACMELSAYWRQLAHPPSPERKGLCLTVEEL